MTLARGLLLVSVASFLLVGLGYLVVPGTMLSIVGIVSDATTEFLMRTEGVALLSAAIFVWAARDARSSVARVVLIGLAFYFVVGSLVDLDAWNRDVVGDAALPSAVIRIALGVLCVVSAVLLRREDVAGRRERTA